MSDDLRGELVRYSVEYLVTRAAVDPTVDRVRERVRRLADRVNERLSGRPLRAPERTIVAALEAIRATDDTIMADYLGAVLAASGDDDSGLPIVQLIGRLSARDLRTHYVLHRVFRRFLLVAQGDRPIEHSQVHVFVPSAELLPALALDDDPQGRDRAAGSLRNLAREGLLGQVLHNGFDGSPPEPFIFGDPERHSQWFKDVKFRTHGLTYTANADGMTLLAWGCGAENPSPETFRVMAIPPLDDIDADCPDATLVDDLPGVDA